MKPVIVTLHLLLAILLLPSATAIAQDQQTMNRQAGADFTKADAEMNKIYAKVIATLDDEGKAKLKAAQRAWVAFRDAEAAFQADREARDGSMAPLIYEGTRSRLTKERTKTLKETIEGQR